MNVGGGGGGGVMQDYRVHAIEESKEAEFEVYPLEDNAQNDYAGVHQASPPYSS